MDTNEFNKILIDELKLLFLRIKNPSDDSLKILLKAIDPTINCEQLKEYIGICKEKFSDFRYNYKNTILKKAQCLEINFRNIALEGFEGLVDEIITENDCRQILASHLSCTHKESFETDHISLNELVIFVKKSLLIGTAPGLEILQNGKLQRKVAGLFRQIQTWNVYKLTGSGSFIVSRFC
ncbi:hypothetical protein C1646_670307 [Rhizophagus diaphanus]|nr:hypothetical protein C1646_670307 [Rhizophagus diaphanus] [Rhizophagus sp. MUCL 43196]